MRTFSTIISHCRNTKTVDEEIRNTRKGLQNIAMDYINGLVVLYTQDNAVTEADFKMNDEGGNIGKHNNYISEAQQKILVTL